MRTNAEPYEAPFHTHLRERQGWTEHRLAFVDRFERAHRDTHDAETVDHSPGELQVPSSVKYQSPAGIWRLCDT